MMADKALISKLADIPMAKPGFDSLGMSAPIIVQMNPDGKWENTRPTNLDEERLKSIVQHLVSSQAVSSAHSYCCQCEAENKLSSSQKTPQYIPVIMMPIYSADTCPFDMDCEIQKMKDVEKGKVKPSKKKQAEAKEEKDDDKNKKPKKRVYQLQRLTDFDLLSQW